MYTRDEVEKWATHQARVSTGIAKFERECRCTFEGSVWKKAYRVPGTPEAGRYAMLQNFTATLKAKLIKSMEKEIIET